MAIIQNKTMKETVSILMTVYNGMPYLIEAVESTLSQTYKDYEFFIIDDASTDDSFVYLSKLKDSRIRLIKNVENLGQVKSLNKGLQLCRGTFVARLDQDDVNLPKRLEEQISFLKDNPNISLICSYEHTINSRGRKILDWKKNIENYGVFIAEIILGQCPVWHPSVMYRKKVVEKLGYYNTEYGPSEDYDLWTKFALNRYEAAIVPEFHLLQREHDARQSIISSDKQKHATFDVHKNIIYDLLGENSLNSCLSSFLLLKDDLCGKRLIGKHLKEIINYSLIFFKIIDKTKQLSDNERRLFKKTIIKRLGYGIYLSGKFNFLPNYLFTFIFYLLSPIYFLKLRKVLAFSYRKFREIKNLIYFHRLINSK